MQKREVIMSGMRPTGKLHLGHYMGVLKNWLSFQHDYNCFFAIADWHALTTKFDQTEGLKQNIEDVALDWLACGINPESSVIYLQSLVPETAELHLLLSMITPQNWVERDTTLKDMVKMLRGEANLKGANIENAILPDNITYSQAKEAIFSQAVYKGKMRSKEEILSIVKEKDDAEIRGIVSYGLLGYPILQTADIIQFNASLVPVGTDQLAHLEISRDIVRRFNHLYKVALIKEPQPKLTQTPMLKGIDGQKMGKSFNNDIKISDTEEITTKKIMQAITDRNRIKKTDPGNPENCEVVCPYYQVFANEETVKKQRYNCENAVWGCADCKRELVSIINSQFKEIRERREKFAQNPEKVHEVIKVGSEKARESASAFLKEIKQAMKLY